MGLIFFFFNSVVNLSRGIIISCNKRSQIHKTIDSLKGRMCHLKDICNVFLLGATTHVLSFSLVNFQSHISQSIYNIGAIGPISVFVQMILTLYKGHRALKHNE